LNEKKIQCPHCFAEHQVGSLQIIGKHEDRRLLLEKRSELQAKDADCDDACVIKSDCCLQRQGVQEGLSKPEELFESVGEEGVSREELTEVTDGSRNDTVDQEGSDGSAKGGTSGIAPVSVGSGWEERSSHTTSHQNDPKCHRPLDNTGRLEFCEEISNLNITDSVTDVAKVRSLHRSLFSRGGEMQDAVFEAAGEIADRVGDPIQLFNVLDRSADPDKPPAIGGGFDNMIRQLFDPHRLAHNEANGSAEEGLRSFMSQIGGGSWHKVPVGMDDAYQGPLKILRASNVTPTIAIHLSHALFDKDRPTVDNVVEYILQLSRGCEVLVAASRGVQQRLIADYADELPTSVIETTTARWCAERESDDPEAVAKSLIPAEIEPDSSTAVVLQIIGEGATDQAKYGKHSRLAGDSRVTVGHAMVRQSIKTLRDHGLINTHGEKDPYAVLTQAGRAVIDRLKQKYGNQSRLNENKRWGEKQRVSQTLNSDADTCSQAQGRVGGYGDASSESPTHANSTPAEETVADACTAPDHNRNHSQGQVESRNIHDWPHHAAMAAVEDGGVYLDNVPSSSVNRSDQWNSRDGYRFDEWVLEEMEDKRGYIYNYDPENNEAVFGTEFHSPLQTGVSIARAMVNPLVFEQILTPSRLDGHGDELDALLSGEKSTLRDEACLGWLKNEYDGEDYIGALKAARKSLEQLLRDYNNSEPGDGGFSDLCQDILQLSHGIVGTATGIYDLLGIDIHRTIRIPGSVSRHLDRGVEPGQSHTSASVTGLCGWFVRAATIASKMGTYTQSRVQFEPRDSKRESISDPPQVTRDDPRGYHVGSWSIVGHGADTLREDLQYAIEHPEEYDLAPQTDADNYIGWIVDISIQSGFDRHTAHCATRRMLEERNLRPTRHAVSLLHAFCGSPHDVTKALAQLSSEAGRRVRADEIRFALSHLPPNRILPSSGNSSTKSKVVHTLITTDEPLSQSELCDRAGVSENSFAGWGNKTSHRDELEAFGVIHHTPDGWTIALPYDPSVDIAASPDTDPDAPTTGLPWYAIIDAEANHLDRQHPTGDREASLQGVLYEAILELEPTENLRSSDHPVCGKLYGSLTADDLKDIMHHRQSWCPLIEFVTAIRECDPDAIGAPDTDRKGVEIRKRVATATLGRPPDQHGALSYTKSAQPTSAD
jgi:DNA-binding PadR family transcriptional regulator